MKKLLIFIACVWVLVNANINVKVNATTVEEGVAGISVSLSRLNNIDTNIYMWSTDVVNIRSGASINSEILATLDKRIKVKVTFNNGEWTKVEYDNMTGYISSKYLRFTELPSLEFTDEEIDLLAKIMWLEARSESDEGLAAIYIVVKNRILSLDFSDTMYEVLSDKTGTYPEFSTWKLLNTAKPDERIYEIIEESMSGLWDDLLDEDYVYFSTSPRNNHGTIKIDDHYFCKY